MAQHYIEIGSRDTAGAEAVRVIGVHPPIPKFVMESIVDRVILPTGSRMGDIDRVEYSAVPYSSVEVHTPRPDEEADQTAAVVAGQIGILAGHISKHAFEIDWQVKDLDAQEKLFVQ